MLTVNNSCFSFFSFFSPVPNANWSVFLHTTTPQNLYSVNVIFLSLEAWSFCMVFSPVRTKEFSAPRIAIFRWLTCWLQLYDILRQFHLLSKISDRVNLEKHFIEEHSLLKKSLFFICHYYSVIGSRLQCNFLLEYESTLNIIENIFRIRVSYSDITRSIKHCKITVFLSVDIINQSESVALLNSKVLTWFMHKIFGKWVGSWIEILNTRLKIHQFQADDVQLDHNLWSQNSFINNYTTNFVQNDMFKLNYYYYAKYSPSISSFSFSPT